MEYCVTYYSEWNTAVTFYANVKFHQIKMWMLCIVQTTNLTFVGVKEICKIFILR